MRVMCLNLFNGAECKSEGVIMKGGKIIKIVHVLNFSRCVTVTLSLPNIWQFLMAVSFRRQSSPNYKSYF